MNILLKLLPRKYKVAYKACLNIFSAVNTWEEVEGIADWSASKLSETGQFDVAEWGELGGKLHIIGAPKRKPKPKPELKEPDVVVAVTP